MQANDHLRLSHLLLVCLCASAFLFVAGCDAHDVASEGDPGSDVDPEGLRPYFPISEGLSWRFSYRGYEGGVAPPPWSSWRKETVGELVWTIANVRGVGDNIHFRIEERMDGMLTHRQTSPTDTLIISHDPVTSRKMLASRIENNYLMIPGYFTLPTDPFNLESLRLAAAWAHDASVPDTLVMDESLFAGMGTFVSSSTTLVVDVGVTNWRYSYSSRPMTGVATSKFYEVTLLDGPHGTGSR